MIASLTLRQMGAGLALLIGSALIVLGLVRLAIRSRRNAGESGLAGLAGSQDDGCSGETVPGVNKAPRGADVVPLPVILLVVAVVGAWLRIFEIDEKTLTHTEGMLPNLPWPADSWPPARYSFYETFWWHYHSELHPPAHYLLMWAWTNVFGISLTSLRFPSAIFGIGSILVGYAIGAAVYRRRVGLLTAAFVAFSGFHIFNSQYARVYMMASFLALFATLALLRVMSADKNRWRWEVMYVLTAWVAIYTQSFIWIVLALHIVWVGVQTDKSEALVRRVVSLQGLIVMLGATAMAHQIYQRVPFDFPPPSIAFVVDYLLLGFAFFPDVLSIPPRTLPLPLYWSYALLAIVLTAIGVGWWGRCSMSHPESTHRTEDRIDTTQEVTPAEAALSPRMLAMVAVGSALVTSGFVIVALRRRDQMSLTIALPFLGLVMPFFVARLRAAIVIGQGARRWRTSFVRISRPTSLLVLLGLVAPAIILLISFFESILNPRAFQVFIPYLMILTAAGAAVVGGRRSARIPLLLVLATLHVGTVLHWRGYPSESRDYRALSEKMNERMQPGDLLVTVPEEHGVTPIYYYLNERGYTYVTRDYAEALANAPTRRVWLVFFESYGWGPFRTTTEEMMSALTDYRVEVEVEALRARAQLLVRIPD